MRYAALLRGINVGGNSAVKMADFRDMLNALGLSNVATYIQSGNAVFESSLEQGTLASTIETACQERFGFTIPTHVRTLEDLDAVVADLPFSEQEIQDATEANPKIVHLHVSFLDQQPLEHHLEDICRGYAGTDQLRLGKRELYFLTFDGLGRSKLAPRIGRAFPLATSRNWKTLTHLTGMLRAL